MLVQLIADVALPQIYACHGVAGIVGLVFTGVFAQGMLLLFLHDVR